MNKASEILLAAIILFTAFSVSCSPKFSKNILTFFFDGVPVADTINADTAAVIKNVAEVAGTITETSVSENKGYIVHYPYKEMECYSCHDENSKSEFLLPQPDLCYVCHDDFGNNFKYLHGPVATGYCTVCHNAHMSLNEKLLIRTNQELCLYCHESKAVFKNEIHTDIADSDCTLCHNPHGGDDRFILN